MNDLKSLNVDELLTMLEEVQDQNDSLWEQLETEKKKNSEAQEEISNLSSENSLLRNTLQQKSEMIVSLNEKIGMLQESDKVLEENLRLRKKNSELQEMNRSVQKESEAVVSAAKEKYDNLIGQLDNREQKVVKRENEVDWRIKAQDAEVARLSENRISGRMRQMENEHRKRLAELESKYKSMRSRYAGIIYMAVAYGVLTTVITAIKNEVIVSDAISFSGSIVKGGAGLYEFAVKAGSFVSQIADRLPWELVATVMHWILLTLTEAVIIGGAALLAFMALKAYIRLFLLVFAAYSLIRAILQAENTTVRNAVVKYAAIVGGSIAGLVLMVHFFGAIGIIAIPIGVMIAGVNR